MQMGVRTMICGDSRLSMSCPIQERKRPEAVPGFCISLVWRWLLPKLEEVSNAPENERELMECNGLKPLSSLRAATNDKFWRKPHDLQQMRILACFSPC
jgi:hypothetical protein